MLHCEELTASQAPFKEILHILWTIPLYESNKYARAFFYKETKLASEHEPSIAHKYLKLNILSIKNEAVTASKAGPRGNCGEKPTMGWVENDPKLFECPLALLTYGLSKPLATPAA
jgi:hypothetical protein